MDRLTIILTTLTISYVTLVVFLWNNVTNHWFFVAFVIVNILVFATLISMKCYDSDFVRNMSDRVLDFFMSKYGSGAEWIRNVKNINDMFNKYGRAALLLSKEQ